LGSAAIYEGFKNWVLFIASRQSFDCEHLFAIKIFGQDQATAHWFAIDQDCAQSAITGFTTIFHTHTVDIAQGVQKGFFGSGLECGVGTIQFDEDITLVSH
jgi:hypothetical protein